MSKLDSPLDDYFAGSEANLIDALDQNQSAIAADLLNALLARISAGIAGFEDKRREEVGRLSNVLMKVGGTDRLESRIKILTDVCFYFTRIGRAFEGMPFSAFARELAVQHSLKNLERMACNALGLAYSDGACYEEACRTLERTLVLARELADPELECLALTNTAALLKEMGLYQDTIEVANKALSFGLESSLRGRYMSLANSINGLFSAHRLRNDEAALHFLRIGSDVLDDNPLSDVVQKTTFEYFRALYLLAANDHETADVLIASAKARAADVRNVRVHILLDIASALCDWASRDQARERRARKELMELHHRSKQSRLYHDDVLRALIEVHKRTLTGELADLNRGHLDDAAVGEGLDALSQIVTRTARIGIDFAKELVAFNTGPHRRFDPSRDATEYVGGLKNAKFYRQMDDRGAAHTFGQPPEKAAPYDPFARARAWLGDGAVPGEIENLGNPGIVGKVRPDAPHVIRKHDELTAIHGDIAELRIESLKATMRTAAYDVAENWALTAEFFDDQTGEHCFRVGRLAGLLAAEIGIDAENCLRIEHASRLHDIGKIAVNELILLKPGPLDSNEVIAMRAHAEVGAQLLQHSTDPTLQLAATIARYHHAWWNGAGYPNASGEGIPLAARICAYADVYDALTNERPYKRPWPHKLAVEQILCESGAHFDPRLMQPFLKVLERHVGSNAQTPSTKLHLQDMEANGLLTSRRRLMTTVQGR
jgi:HD-GYP domain-containing protein (c-di-GMP phosphodiesterase class II)